MKQILLNILVSNAFDIDFKVCDRKYANKHDCNLTVSLKMAKFCTLKTTIVTSLY